jgi:hypothetical protein
MLHGARQSRLEHLQSDGTHRIPYMKEQSNKFRRQRQVGIESRLVAGVQFCSGVRGRCVADTTPSCGGAEPEGRPRVIDPVHEALADGKDIFTLSG